MYANIVISSNKKRALPCFDHLAFDCPGMEVKICLPQEESEQNRLFVQSTVRMRAYCSSSDQLVSISVVLGRHNQTPPDVLQMLTVWVPAMVSCESVHRLEKSVRDERFLGSSSRAGCLA
ncbi:MAG: hypothetical protein KC736_03290 [Candidatus Moranbacteria bacterium]|nr:hypothetical protein [Candidatus Moranbacteria bacterium]